MPELPEVETIVQGLAPVLTGLTVADLFILDARDVLGDVVSFQQRVLGQAITAVRRRGKLVVVDLASQDVLVFHLKMTGRLWFAPNDAQPGPHTVAAFVFDSFEMLLFDDQRRFGYTGVFSPDGLRQWDYWAGLGPEPLQITPQEMAESLADRKAVIKAMLLDQTVVAGVGNIYADESLHRAGIHPRERANTIGTARLERLFSCLQEVLLEALAAGGSSIRDYRNAFGRHGRFQEDFAVYGRAGKHCRICSTTLEKASVAGRTTTFCPQCQPFSLGGSVLRNSARMR
ncbi:MAG: bifunctional DNA-formamidopyrimidine glycosylase/DNA-(apurinic or apyrimidinic site) lyase [Deltaproteobacteria bacterium]|nr:bifunctional DNA-formamidopyrimidine glycosylase/DNA-(apurinic or apyrimidinic site) lyase [Deltaproteobacteria bacterium]